jgi:hypothetical protein
MNSASRTPRFKLGAPGEEPFAIRFCAFNTLGGWPSTDASIAGTLRIAAKYHAHRGLREVD